MDGGTRGRVKLFFTVGIICLIAGIATLIAGVVLIVKSDDSSKSTDDGERYIEPSWGYQCQNNICVKVPLTTANILNLDGLSRCRLHCNKEDLGTVWPHPSGNVQISDEVIRLNPNEITFTSSLFEGSEIWKMAIDRFLDMQHKKIPKYEIQSGGESLLIEVNVEVADIALSLNTNEGYKLEIMGMNHGRHAVITANNFLGARHGLETLSQLIVYDNLKNDIAIIATADITDAPKYKYRGVMLDTNRNYYSVNAIKRTINGLAMQKLNTFHWHITDSNSFPMVLKSHPEMSEVGAYSPQKVYTESDFKDIVLFAQARGVRVLPEFDAPAHIGEGWQGKGMGTCTNLPFIAGFYCWQPPCDHLDPSQDAVYDILEEIYSDMYDSFGHPDLFHMGGDEIFFNCWNASESLTTWMLDQGWDLEPESFMRLWGYFQGKALERLDKVSSEKVTPILWTSTLTEDPYAIQYLDRDRYIIQSWLGSDDPHTPLLLASGFNIIISDNDNYYLDCGFESWMGTGHNWCSPYNTWQQIYDARLENVGNGQYNDQIFGAETPLWSEQVDEQSLDGRIWPRASALAERLWSNPETNSVQAQSRLIYNRNYLVEIGGLSAQRLQPEWCLQNEKECGG